MLSRILEGHPCCSDIFTLTSSSPEHSGDHMTLLTVSINCVGHLLLRIQVCATMPSLRLLCSDKTLELHFLDCILVILKKLLYYCLNMCVSMWQYPEEGHWIS